NNETLEKKYKFTKDELKEYSDFTQKDNDELYTKIKAMRNLVRENAVKSKVNYMTVSNSYMLPVNIHRILLSMARSDGKQKKISPKYIVDEIEKFLSISETP